jgi:hypothetical protein
MSKDYTETNWYKLLTVLQSYAPDEAAQVLVTKQLHEAQAEGASESALELMLAGAIVDGLRFGNWPWIVDRLHLIDAPKLGRHHA